MKDNRTGAGYSQWPFQRAFKRFTYDHNSAGAADSVKRTLRQRFKSIRKERDGHRIRKWKNNKTPASKKTGRILGEPFDQDVSSGELRIISGISCFEDADENGDENDYEYRDEPSLEEIPIQNSAGCGVVGPSKLTFKEQRELLRYQKSEHYNLSRAAFVLDSKEFASNESIYPSHENSLKGNHLGPDCATSECYGSSTLKRFQYSLLSMFKLANKNTTEQYSDRPTSKNQFNVSVPQSDFAIKMSMSYFSHIPTVFTDFKTEEDSPYGNHAKYFI
ncbi:hypothetical protein HG535_0H00400 [Zygotorulaspora mrakii]|uniref:Uncharacterized protein n=1 Tax=Zygotorulaspora mrakii TaxID=42260 RepID=A0A7H9B7R8_ZYGMR|nr:uncharacterized protein HG535_0H00400 [Zygotorulaspora mrakii]QLG74715.1 hypothetical protein HG535_0H00400 [Zygotorulaspora mrakii]